MKGLVQDVRVTGGDDMRSRGTGLIGRDKGDEPFKRRLGVVD